jgi:hypothetical protein
VGIQRKSIKDGAVGPEKLAGTLQRHRYWYEPFAQQPLGFGADGYADPAGTDAMLNMLFTGFNLFQWYNIGTQTIVIPAMTTDGHYDVGFDQTAAEGIEMVFGGLYSTANEHHPRNYLSGTDEYYARIKVNIEDVSGVDLFFGFRKSEAYQAALTTYTDVFGLQILGDSSSAAAAVNWVTQLNDATDLTTTALTTLADATSMELEVRVKGRTARPLVDQAPPSTGATFTVDSADIVFPVLRLLNTTDVGGEVKLIAAEGGLLADHPGTALPAV